MSTKDTGVVSRGRSSTSVGIEERVRYDAVWSDGGSVAHDSRARKDENSSRSDSWESSVCLDDG